MCIGAASALHQIGPLKADCLPRTRHEDLSRSESRAHVLRESPVVLVDQLGAGFLSLEGDLQREKRKVAAPSSVAAAVAQLHGPGPIGRLNAKIGPQITVVVGKMWCAYLFALLALVSAPSAFKTGNSLIIVAWVAQTFLQLALLPIIIVGQNVQDAAADARAEATYNDAAAVLEEAKQIQAHLEAQDAEIVKILSTLTSPKAV
jgi:hypothetical protein